MIMPLLILLPCLGTYLDVLLGSGAVVIVSLILIVAPSLSWFLNT
jgi:hypothetical protein